MVGAATAAATAAHLHSNGCGAGPERHQLPSKRGAGESASSTPAQDWARRAARSLAARGPCGARGVAWRNQPMRAPNCTPQLAPLRSRPRPGSDPPLPTQPHARANTGQACRLHKHHGRVGWLGALGPHRVVTNKEPPAPVGGENKGVRFEPPPLWTQQIIALGQHSEAATVRHWGVVQRGPCGRDETRSASSAASRASMTPLSPAVDAKCIRKWGRR